MRVAINLKNTLNEILKKSSVPPEQMIELIARISVEQVLGLNAKVSLQAALCIGNIIDKKVPEDQISSIFENFVTVKVSAAMTAGGDQAVLYLGHLKAMLG